MAKQLHKGLRLQQDRLTAEFEEEKGECRKHLDKMSKQFEDERREEQERQSKEREEWRKDTTANEAIGERNSGA